MKTQTETFKVELANKFVRGCSYAVGNLYGVARYVNGCRTTYVLSPQEDEQKARALAAELNGAAKGGV